MSEVRYRELVDSSGGHAHDRAESEANEAGRDAADAPDERATTDVHADGTPHDHKK
jgi:hypothetical protein